MGRRQLRGGISRMGSGLTRGKTVCSWRMHVENFGIGDLRVNVAIMHTQSKLCLKAMI